jgi:DNA-binding transcriptional regulator LsrR (DeoR family)
VVASDIAALIADYRSGVGCSRLARKYGLAETTVLAKLRTAGVEIRTHGKLSPEDMVEVRRLRAAGWTQQQIADRFGVTRAAVSLRLSRTPE